MGWNSIRTESEPAYQRSDVTGVSITLADRLLIRNVLGLIILVTVILEGCGMGPEIGRSENSAPNFTLQALGNQNYSRGEKISLSQFEGQPIIINFWFPS